MSLRLFPMQKSLAVIVPMVALVVVPSAAMAINHVGVRVDRLQSFYASSDCIYFTLVNVNSVDPITTNPWLAIQRNQPGSKDAYTMLLAAKLAGRSLNVITSGTLTCGYAGVASIDMQ